MDKRTYISHVLAFFTGWVFTQIMMHTKLGNIALDRLAQKVADKINYELLLKIKIQERFYS